MSQIGYFGVVVPAKDFWQGFFIDDQWREGATDAINRTRSHTTLAHASKVISRLDIPGDNQSLIGSFCAAIVEAALGETGHLIETPISDPNAVLGIYGYAVCQLIGRQYFWIEATVADEGTYTTIQPIAVSSIAQARTYIDKIPVVRQIKRRLLTKLEHVPPQREGQNRVSRMRSTQPRQRFPALDQLINQINARTPRKR